uniref:Uncharacterized protein n=1 Tax=Plectus sambesii TaxID=2011161 RepID=A0A914VTA3_9BILA
MYGAGQWSCVWRTGEQVIVQEETRFDRPRAAPTNVLLTFFLSLSRCVGGAPLWLPHRAILADEHHLLPVFHRRRDPHLNQTHPEYAPYRLFCGVAHLTPVTVSSAYVPQ